MPCKYPLLCVIQRYYSKNALTSRMPSQLTNLQFPSPQVLKLTSKPPSTLSIKPHSASFSSKTRKKIDKTNVLLPWECRFRTLHRLFYCFAFVSSRSVKKCLLPPARRMKKLICIHTTTSTPLKGQFRALFPAFLTILQLNNERHDKDVIKS